jgi:hypothetical protein
MLGEGKNIKVMEVKKSKIRVVEGCSKICSDL